MAQDQNDRHAEQRAKVNAIKRRQCPLNGVSLSHAYNAVATEFGDQRRWQAENLINPVPERLAGVSKLEELEDLLREPIGTFHRLKQDHTDVANARRLIETVIEAANKQIVTLGHAPITWEALEQSRER